MAQSRDAAEIHWYDPELRGVLPLAEFHVPRKLRKDLRQARFEMRVNTDFAQVIKACATRDETWINDTIIDAYMGLHRLGFAHSVECWRQEALVGGLYGVALGGAFFGESMFSLEANASKAALVHLVELLCAGGYVLLDTQYVNDHLLQFGVREIPRAEYMAQLRIALTLSPLQVF